MTDEERAALIALARAAPRDAPRLYKRVNGRKTIDPNPVHHYMYVAQDGSWWITYGGGVTLAVVNSLRAKGLIEPRWSDDPRARDLAFNISDAGRAAL